jgi:Piwi domain
MVTYQTQEQALTINSLEVIPNKESLKVYSRPFETGVIVELRKQHKEYYFYAQAGFIYAWQLIDNPTETLPSAFKDKIINRKNDTLVFNKIFESCFVQFFKARNRVVTKVRNSSNWELEIKTGGKDFNGFSTIPLLTFCFHPLYSVKSDRLVLGLSVRVSAKYKFTISEEQINQKRVDTRDWKRDEQGTITPFYANVLKYVQATNQHNSFKQHFDEINKDSFTYEKLVFFYEQFNTTIKGNLTLPDGLKVENFAFYNLSNSNFGSSIISKPRYYYYQDRTAKTFYNDAVKEQKPYTFDKFNGEEINILVLTPIVHEGSADELVAKLRPVLTDMFHLPNINFDTITADIPNQTYIDAIDQKLSDKVYKLAIVVVSQKDKEVFSIPTSPYYSSKAKLLNQKVPTQKVTIETIRKNDKILIESIALNIYSKMGGVAWAVEQTQREKVEIVIGISSTVDFNKNRIIGFANIFDYNGNYLIGDCSYLSTQEDYLENLKIYLIEVIKRVIEIKGIEKNEKFRLIFHLSKEAGKKTELKAIDFALKAFSDYQIQFGIVHLSYEHNLRIFSNKGNTEPTRGTFVQIATFQALLHFGNRTRVPVLARLDQRSQFKDIYDISKQVLYFSHLCYRNFRAANVPVTIKYPSLMAKLTHELMQVPNWDPKQLNRIKEQLWFI